VVKTKGYKWPEHLNIGSGYEVANVIKKWLPLLEQDTGIKIHLAHTTDNASKFKWLHYGLVDIVDGGQFEFGRVLEGVRRYAGRDTGAFPVRVAWMQSKYDSGFVVRGDSPIREIHDIKPGVRVVDMRSYLTSQTNLEGLLVWAGIKDLEKEVTWVAAHNSEEKMQLITGGKADIAYALPTSPLTFEAEKNPCGLRWLELNAEKDPEGAKRFHERCPLIGLGLMFRGVPSSICRWGMVGTDQLCCREDANPELIYHLAKWFNENWESYKDLHAWLAQSTLENLMVELDTIFIPCHEGLIEYLKELGLWSRAHAIRQKENVALVARYCQASQQAMRRADNKGIVVSADNPVWVSLWESYKKEQGIPRFDMRPSLGKGRELQKKRLKESQRVAA